MHPCIPRKCIQPSLRQPHSCRMLDSANSSLPFLLPFPRAHATNQLHTNARLVRGDPPWTRNARRFPNSFAREFFFQSFQIFLSFFPLPCNRSMESYQSYFYEILIFFSSNSYLNFGENWTANLGRCPSLPLFLRSAEIRDAITRLITSVQ